VIVSIFSPKGGVGKTTLSLALAELLSQSRKTCIIEFDFSPGDFPSLLDISKDNNLLRAVKNGVRKVVQKPEKRNFYVITGGYPDTHEKFTREEIDKLLMELDSNFEISVFDIQPGLIENSIEVLKNSDKIIVVTEDEKVTALRTARVLDWLENDGLINLSKIDIIANKANSKLVNIPENIITFKVPRYGFQLTFDNRALLKHMEYYKKFILGEPIPKSFLIKPPEIKKVDPHDIQVFITAAVGNLGSSEDSSEDRAERKINYQERQEKPADTNLEPEFEDLPEESKISTFAEIKYDNKDNRRGNMVYIKTHYEILNSTISKEIENVTDDIEKADVLVVSSFSEEEIDQYVNTNKKILLFTTPYYESYAKRKGIKYVFTEEASVSEIISAVEELLNEKSAVETKEPVYEAAVPESFGPEPATGFEPYRVKPEPKVETKVYSFKEHHDNKYKKNIVFASDAEAEEKVALTLTANVSKEKPVDYIPENKKDTSKDHLYGYSEIEHKDLEEKEVHFSKQQTELAGYSREDEVPGRENRLTVSRDSRPGFSEEKTSSYKKDSTADRKTADISYIEQSEPVDYRHIFEDFKKDISAVAAKYEVIFKEHSLKAVQQATEELNQKIAEALAEKEKAEKELEAVKKELEQVRTELQARKEAALQLKKILANL